MSLETKHFYDFGDFRLDAAEKVLLRDGKFIPVTPKVYETLCALVESAGRTVEKDELMRRIWEDRFVEEGNLTFNVGMLRKALGDDAQKPTFIETVPRRGYRFIAEVKEVSAAENLLPESAETFAAPDKSFLPIAAVGVLLLGLLAVGAWLGRDKIFAENSNAPILSGAFHSEKISSSGKVGAAVISPDGKYVAYTDETNGKYAVWLRRLETLENIQIVQPSEEVYGGLAFARDGQSIFFMRKPAFEQAQSSVYRVSTFGGVPEKILERAEGWLSLSPDDRQISFVRCPYQADDFCSLFVADADGRAERKILTRPRPFRISDNQFSPDGKRIAFAVGQSGSGASDFRLRQIDLASGAESEISPKTFFDIKNLKWLPGGDGLLVTAMEFLDGRAKIWQISTATGEARSLTKDATDYCAVSLNKDASRMIATKFGNNFQLYLSSGGETKILTAAREATFAPDGRIVYATDDGDIWTIRREGGEQRQLTNNAFKDFSPAVSPDNRFIFFTSNRTGANQVWRMNADGGNQTQLTKTEGGYPRFASPDGRWVYYESGLSQTIWRASTEGGEEAQVSESKVYAAAFSSDGDSVAFFFRDREKDNQPRIAVMRIADGKIVRIFELADAQDPISIAWSNDNRTINYIMGGGGKNLLWSQSPDEEKPRLVADLGDKEVGNFAFAPGGDSLIYTRGEWLHDAVLIDGLK